MRKVLKNFSYTLTSNIIALIISTIVTFVVPKTLGLETYSYFQLYLFYINYIGFLHFGWADGVYLRYGGKYYKELNKKKFGGQFWLMFFFELFVSGCVCLFTFYADIVWDRKVVFFAIGLAIGIHLPRTLLQYILQGTNRIKEYAVLIILDKAVYLIIIMFALLFGTTTYISIIAADLAGKLCALFYAVYQCRDFVFCKIEKPSAALLEAKENIIVGIKLMFANLASMLIIGIVRFGIENQWDVVTFGKVSLTLSVSNLLMVFIRAVAMILFPLLRRTEYDKLVPIYKSIRIGLMVCLFGMLIFYYPLRVLLSIWLPQYTDSLKYMAILFPMCIYESKMSMLVETYMKTIRKEKSLLRVNLISVCLSFILTGIFAYGLHNLDLTISVILFLLIFRCILAEILLSNLLEIEIKKDITIELVLTVGFIITSWFISGLIGLFLYCVIYIIYLFFMRKEIKKFCHQLFCVK